jgi:hypothetical protein
MLLEIVPNMTQNLARQWPNIEHNETRLAAQAASTSQRRGRSPYRKVCKCSGPTVCVACDVQPKWSPYHVPGNTCLSRCVIEMYVHVCGLAITLRNKGNPHDSVEPCDELCSKAARQMGHWTSFRSRSLPVHRLGGVGLQYTSPHEPQNHTWG